MTGGRRALLGSGPDYLGSILVVDRLEPKIKSILSLGPSFQMPESRPIPYKMAPVWIWVKPKNSQIQALIFLPRFKIGLIMNQPMDSLLWMFINYSWLVNNEFHIICVRRLYADFEKHACVCLKKLKMCHLKLFQVGIDSYHWIFNLINSKKKDSDIFIHNYYFIYKSINYHHFHFIIVGSFLFFFWILQNFLISYIGKLYHWPGSTLLCGPCLKTISFY